ncbi:MAG: OmpA family protein [Desulfobacterium sp.]|nr:OmpA family protein [Desulfobacterium sp.]
MIRYLIVLLGMCLVCACGSKTTVILLPQDNGKTGSVIVTNNSFSTTLDEPYTYIKVSDGQSDYSVEAIEPNQVTAEFERLLEAEPVKPVHYTLYFKHDAIVLTKASLKLIPKVLQSAKDREPSEITIIGHTDSKGSRNYNIKLSLQRANAVKRIIKEYDANVQKLYVQSYGENDPLIVTGDNVSEARNRRVEIMIR